VLADLADRAEAVVIETAGTSAHGVVIEVGDDYIALRAAQGQVHYVVRAAIATVRAAGGSAPAGLGHERVAAMSERALIDCLHDLAGTDPEVAVAAIGGREERGTLRAIGRDYLRVQTGPKTSTYLPLQAAEMLTITRH
jgi:hypothetical protein